MRAAGDTHPGLQRDVNEDRFHVDLARGLFIVVDGVGGQAAGGKAADVAMTMLRTRLERETGTVPDRVREAITVANNEIRRVAALRPEWQGMACVLTVAVVEDGHATIGHVGDTRLYKLREGRIEKATRDHSPVGEREDAREISEIEAMRHPRRNEVYRDVGSEAHDVLDADFIDIHEIAFEPDAALLLCSDGLTDLVDSATINELIARGAGRPREVVASLIQAANDAGGKDNVTVVYVEGDRFAAPAQSAEVPVRRRSGRLVRAALVVLLTLVLGYAALRQAGHDPLSWSWPQAIALPSALPNLPSLLANGAGPIVVTPSELIAAAIASAPRGASIVVEPGEYRERLVLANDVRVLSRVTGGAIIRLPSTASEGDPAVVADNVSGAELVGFRIVGDAATPLGTGIFAKNSDVSIVDVEITGAAKVAVDMGEGASLTLLASRIHDNPGAALAIRAGASPRVSHNLFAHNGLSEKAGAAFIVEPRAQPVFNGNVFKGAAIDLFRALGEDAETIAHKNWIIPAR